MVYFAVYLAVGAIFLLSILVANRDSARGGRSLKFSLAQAIDHDTDYRRYWLPVTVAAVVVPFMAATLAILVWPAVLVAKTYDTLSTKARLKEKPFAITERDLLRQLSIQEIEALEQVDDPMGAVPGVPFGFLNLAWTRYLDTLGPHDALWSFSSTWKNGSRTVERRGYVAVQGNKVRQHILVTQTMLAKFAQ